MKFANRLRGPGKTKGRGRDREVLVGFEDWSVKSMNLDVLWEQPKLMLEGQKLTFYSDLCPLTLKRRREWKFITNKLTRLEIAYRVGVPLQVVHRL